MEFHMETECFNENKIAQLKETIASLDSSPVEILKALAHENRLKVYQLLKESPCCVCDLAHAFEAPVSTISQYLKILKSAGLVSSKSDGKFLIYSACEIEEKLNIIKE